MTRSLGLLVQILVHSIPAFVMGQLLEETLRAEQSWDRAPQPPLLSPIVMYFGCLLAAAFACSSLYDGLRNGSKGSGLICALAVPYLGAAAWLWLAGSTPMSALTMAIGAAIFSMPLSLPIQTWLMPWIGKRCAQLEDRPSKGALPNSRKNGIETLSSILLYAVPSAFVLAAFTEHPTGKQVWLDVEWIGVSSVLAAGIWITAFKPFQSAPLASTLALGALCAVLVPLFAIVLYCRVRSTGDSNYLTYVLLVKLVRGLPVLVPTYAMLAFRLCGPTAIVGRLRTAHA